MTFRIRALHLSDLDAVMHIQARCYIDIEPERREVMASKLAIKGHNCLVIEGPTGIAGYLICHPWELNNLPALDVIQTRIPAGAACFYLHDLAIDPDARGLRLAQRLVQQALRDARDQGFSRAALVAIQGSVPFWQTFGFTDHSPQLPWALQQRLYDYGANAAYLAHTDL